MVESSQETDDPTMVIKDQFYPKGFYDCTEDNLKG